jgi:biopolymer transport protein ExbB
LITTAGGILVAVEAVVLYNYFQTRLGRMSIELRLLADEFVELLRERPASAGLSGSPTPESATSLSAAVESPAEG